MSSFVRFVSVWIDAHKQLFLLLEGVFTHTHTRIPPTCHPREAQTHIHTPTHPQPPTPIINDNPVAYYNRINS